MRRLEGEQATADSFAWLAVQLHSAGSVEKTIDAVVQFALDALDCSYAGVALRSSSRAEIPAVTDAVVTKIFQFQLDRRSGPLIETMHGSAAVLVRDTHKDDRWPEWAATVAGLGVCSVLDVPLQVGDPPAETVGVLALYSREADGFDQDHEATAHILARHASVAVTAARRLHNLTAAVDARKVVGQAMGILMERYSLDEDRAFQVLKRYSQESRRKLRDVAEELIGSRNLPK
jgi:GAF domain-containing protein